MRQGWSCPKCGGAHAPDVQTCPELKRLVPEFPFVPSPTPEFPFDDGMCDACRRGGVCMCVRPLRDYFFVSIA